MDRFVKDILTPMLLDAFSKRPRGHWIEVLSADGVPCGPINEIGEVFANPLRLWRTPAVYASSPMSVGGAANRRFRDRS